MTTDAELRALTQSIGEHAVDLFGREHLSALSVTLDPADLTALVAIGLVDDSSDLLHGIADQFAELEELFLEEAVLQLRFVEASVIRTAPASTQPRYAMV